MPAYQEIIDALRSAVSDTGLITDPADISAAALDGRGRRQGEALAVVRPASTEEVSLVMKTAAAYGLFVIPQGGNTSNVGGATPEPGASAETARRTLILQLGHMKRILNVDTVNNTITLEAGVVLQDAQKAASDAGRLLPLSLAAEGSCQTGGVIAANAGGVHVLRYGMARRQVLGLKVVLAGRLLPLSLAAEGSCQTGGVIAANAGGVHVLRYGMARRQVLGLKVVLASGEVLDLMKGLRKDNSGYSLRDVLIGSEGTLGVITEAVLALEPMPRSIVSAWITPRRLEDVETLFETLEAAFGPGLTAFELIGRTPLESLSAVTGMTPPVPLSDWQVLLDVSDWRRDSDESSEELEGVLAPLLENGLILDGAVSRSESDREAFWRCRETIPSAVKREGGNVKHDISVPRSSLVRFIRETSAALEETFPGVKPSVFGHYGDGNLHFNVGPAGIAFPHEEAVHRLVHDRVLAEGGSIAAEHGVGSLKTQELKRTKTPEELAAMRALKLAFDPDNRLNPGRIVEI